MKTKARIKSLNGLKVVAALLIFWQHCAPYNNLVPIPDQGARAVEIFFVVSGFLTAYNHYDLNIPTTWKNSLYFTIRRIAKFWPLHIISLLIFAVFVMGREVFSNTKNLILNIFLLQAWSSKQEVYFSFNGVSWYLSAIIFCYLMTPTLLSLIKRVKREWLLIASALLVRFFFSYCKYHFNSTAFYDIYTFPPSRCMEYFLGMVMFPLFERVKNKNYSAGLYSFAEILTIILALAVFFLDDKYWHSAVCVLAICPVVFVLAEEKGILSRILASRPFILFSKIQMEFFLLHAMIAYILINNYSFRTVGTYMLCSFTVTIILSWLYHRFLYDPLEKLFMKIINIDIYEKN